jgi:hypothetical protein
VIATQRTFRIKKGSFAEFHRASAQGVWPYFERIGARIVGMWLVSEDEREAPSPDYDTVILVTRYESREHWQATRNPLALGGDGPLWDRCRSALEKRRSLTIETWLRFLDPGAEHTGGPYFR